MDKPCALDISTLDKNVLLKKVEGILRHVENVKQDTEFLGKRYIEAGQVELGIDLIRNGRGHDSSKLRGIEFLGLTQNENGELLKLAIAHHQRVNMHHPEYWQGIDNMPELYLAEMVCDWKSRASEQGTGLREWIKEKALPKYGASPTGKTAKKIKAIVDMLLDEPFKSPAEG